MSLKMALFDRSNTSSCWSAVVPFSSHLTLNNVMALRSYSRSLEMTPFDGSHIRVSIRLPLQIVISYIVSEVKRDMGRKSRRFFSYLFYIMTPWIKRWRIFSRCFFSQPSQVPSLPGSTNRVSRKSSVYSQLKRVRDGQTKMRSQQASMGRHDKSPPAAQQFRRQTDKQKDIVIVKCDCVFSDTFAVQKFGGFLGMMAVFAVYLDDITVTRSLIPSSFVIIIQMIFYYRAFLFKHTCVLMSINVNKSCCIRIGPRSDVNVPAYQP